MALMHLAIHSRPEVLEKVRGLMLLEFRAEEMVDAVALVAGHPVDVESVQLAIDAVKGAWMDNPEGDDLKLGLAQHWGRSRMFQRDLLGMYSDMIASYNAISNGEIELPDGRPVQKVKPADIAAMAALIQKLDADHLGSRIKARQELFAPKAAPRVEQEARPALALAANDDEPEEDVYEVQVTRLE